MKIVIVSGYFNPIHKGHLEYFTRSKSFGDKLFVIVNNDKQRELKGTKEFQLEDERMLIVGNLKMVDEVILSIDTDRTVRETLRSIDMLYGTDNELFFTNGGDQNNETIDRKSTRLNSSHPSRSRMPSSA